MTADRKTPLRHVLVRLVVLWAAETVGLLLAAWVLPEVSVANALDAALAVAAIGVVNAALYPLIASVLAPIAALTFGLLTLALNAGAVLLANDVVEGFDVGGFGSALVLVLWLALVNMLVTGALAIDDEGSFYRAVVLRQARRSRRDAPARGEPEGAGVLFLEIDGLSRDVLERALAGGYMPALSEWIESGSHSLAGWECDLSSQTSASQAGLLHGHNERIPAFRWYDREVGRPVVSAKPADAALIEQRASDGEGLLAGGGASRGNLLTGDADQVTLTLSSGPSLAERKVRAAAWRSYLTNPYNVPRTLLLFIGDALTEIRAARRQRRRDERPRVHRGGRYPLLRAATTAFLPEATVNMLIGDVFRGAPAAYATFVAYDEVAHHSGIAAPDALAVLTRLDRYFARLERATRLAPRPYHLVVLSDHGQTQGATFLQRHGLTLERLVQDLIGAPVTGGGDTTEEQHQQLHAALGELGEDAPAGAGWAAKRLGKAVPPPESALEPPEGDANVLVYASGNLGLVYFADLDRRATLEEIRLRHPKLIDGLAAHPGIGFVGGYATGAGPVAIGAEGEHELESGRVTRADPLEGYGPNAAGHLRRELDFPNAPDLLVMSAYYPGEDGVAAFEELVGSHGGLGGPQSRAFVLHPSSLPMPDGELVGAAAVHRVLKSWRPA